MEAVSSVTLVQCLYAAVLGLLGLAMGSFLNVVAYRVPLGMSLLHPPSSCPSCATRIPSRDNIPLFGWLLLGGKCRTCRAPISWRYPAVELATGVLWGIEGWRLGAMQWGFYHTIFTGLIELAFLASLVVTFLIDWDNKIILDEVSLGGLAVSLVAALVLPHMHHAVTPALYEEYHPLLNLILGQAPGWWRSLAAALVGMAVGLALSLGIYFLGNVAFRAQIEEARRHDPDVDSALGIGDIKLMAFYGAFLGWKAVLIIFIVASLSGAIAGTGMKLCSGSADGARGWAALRNRWHSGSSVIPFGPFLVVGALAAFFLDWRWIGW